jgi:hypothetical protein
MRRCKLSLLKSFALTAIVIALSFGFAMAQDNANKDVNTSGNETTAVNNDLLDQVYIKKNMTTPSAKRAAAKHNAALGLKVVTQAPASPGAATAPGSVPADETTQQDQNQPK